MHTQQYTYVYCIFDFFFFLRRRRRREKINFIPLKRDRRSLHLNTMGVRTDLVLQDGQTIYFYYRFILISALTFCPQTAHTVEMSISYLNAGAASGTQAA